LQTLERHNENDPEGERTNQPRTSPPTERSLDLTLFELTILPLIRGEILRANRRDGPPPSILPAPGLGVFLLGRRAAGAPPAKALTFGPLAGNGKGRHGCCREQEQEIDEGEVPTSLV